MSLPLFGTLSALFVCSSPSSGLWVVSFSSSAATLLLAPRYFTC